MSKEFKYKNGFVGTVSDAVAAILEKKGEGKVVGTAPVVEKKEDTKK